MNTNDVIFTNGFVWGIILMGFIVSPVSLANKLVAGIAGCGYSIFCLTIWRKK